MRVLFFICCLFGTSLLFAQSEEKTEEGKEKMEESEAKHPRFQFLRANEDYSYLSGKADKNFWEKLKYIGNEKSYLTLGGNIRSEFQILLNEEWEEENDDKGLLFQRFMVHADWRISQHVRVFGQLKSGIDVDRNGEPSGLDRDELDIHQVFVDFRLGKSQLQIGRQELWYGSRRLLSIREGTNVRQSFDGARWIWQNEKHRFDALYFHYNPQRTGVFDNDIDNSRKLWGAYYVWSPKESLNLDAYYLGVNNRDETASFEEGRSDETRHSVGVRHWGKKGKFSFNTEAIYQFGKFGTQDISAWTISSDLSYRLSEEGLEPVLGLKAEVISGDRNAGDGELQTFNALYPRGGYFGLLALIGPANLIDIHPSVGLALSEKVEVGFDWDVFWRYSTEDGIYFPSNRLNVASNNSNSRFIGHQVGGEIVYSVSRFFELEASCFYFSAGDFLQDVTAGADVWQIGMSAKFTF